MARAIGDFSATNNPESELFTFDFTDELRAGDSIASVVEWTCTVSTGIDADPASRLVGSPTFAGLQVTQRGADFVAGVQYIMAAVVLTTLGDRKELWAFLSCEVVGC